MTFLEIGFALFVLFCIVVPVWCALVLSGRISEGEARDCRDVRIVPDTPLVTPIRGFNQLPKDGDL